MSENKRKAVYRPEVQKKWDEANKDKKRHYTDRTSARRFIRKSAILEDLEELEQLIAIRKSVYPQQLDNNNKPVQE